MARCRIEFIANGRRFIVNVRQSGLPAPTLVILPYHTLPNMVLLAYIGGCSNQPTWRYSVNNDARYGGPFIRVTALRRCATRMGRGWKSLNRRNYISNDNYAVDVT